MYSYSSAIIIISRRGDMKNLVYILLLSLMACSGSGSTNTAAVVNNGVGSTIEMPSVDIESLDYALADTAVSTAENTPSTIKSAITYNDDDEFSLLACYMMGVRRRFIRESKNITMVSRYINTTSQLFGMAWAADWHYYEMIDMPATIAGESATINIRMRARYVEEESQPYHTDVCLDFTQSGNYTFVEQYDYSFVDNFFQADLISINSEERDYNSYGLVGTVVTYTQEETSNGFVTTTQTYNEVSNESYDTRGRAHDYVAVEDDNDIQWIQIGRYTSNSEIFRTACEKYSMPVE